MTVYMQAVNYSKQTVHLYDLQGLHVGGVSPS